MGLNEEELREIRKATSGILKDLARKQVAQALRDIKPKVDDAKRLEGSERGNALQALVEIATTARRQTLRFGAISYGQGSWAAAAACESWLHELIMGTPEGIYRVENLVDDLINRA